MAQDSINEHLADIHVIEPGADGELVLFRVQVLIHEDTREALGRGEDDGWRRVIGRTRMLIAEHIAQQRALESSP